MLMINSFVNLVFTGILISKSVHGVTNINHVKYDKF